jgi:TonB family protein
MSEAWSQWEGHVINGEFHLQKYLGGSEQSAVFLTEDRGQEPQPAAIKLIAADPASAELQLLRWGLAQRLLHPHLIRLLRKGRCRLDNREMIFAVMEYAEENLAQILLERPLTPQEAREMLEPTLDALAYLHSQGFVHGHLKPANILAINDQLKLASDSVCGTIQTNKTPPDPGKPSPYDPPEMAAGARSPAADVWSLGMTLTEVLTQHLPSWNDQSDPQADPIVPEDLPAPFLDIVRGCLRRDPKLRLTIAGIAARLYSGSPQKPARAAATTASPQPLPQNPPPVSSREGSAIRRFAFPAIIGGGAIVVALLAGSGLLHRQPQTQPDVATAKPEPTPKSQEPGAVKPSPKTASRKTKSETGQQPGSTGNQLETAALQAKPQPASLRSDAPVASGDSRAADNGAGAVRQVVPDVPQSASDTIQGTIRVSVRVKVDTSGNVTGADLDYAGSSRYFARLSLEAAQRWKFAPSDTAAARDFVLHFEFKNSGAKAFATRVGG